MEKANELTKSACVALSNSAQVKFVLIWFLKLNLNEQRKWVASWFYYASNTESYIGRICFLPRPSQHPCIRNNKIKIAIVDKQTCEADRLELVLNHLSYEVQFMFNFSVQSSSLYVPGSRDIFRGFTLCSPFLTIVRPIGRF